MDSSVLTVSCPDLDKLFRYHAPRPDQIPRYEALRAAAKAFAEEIVRCCPPSADRTAAIRKVREAVMTANAAVALEADLHAPEPLGVGQ